MKQAKKAAKDLDEDDLAYLEKKRAGTTRPDPLRPRGAITY